MPLDYKITTELLVQGALVFSLMDAVFVPVLMRYVKKEIFLCLRNSLTLAAALVWLGIWSWALGNFWETVYVYVLPLWGRTWIPWIAFLAAGIVASRIMGIGDSTRR